MTDLINGDIPEGLQIQKKEHKISLFAKPPKVKGGIFATLFLLTISFFLFGYMLFWKEFIINQYHQKEPFISSLLVIFGLAWFAFLGYIILMGEIGRTEVCIDKKRITLYLGFGNIAYRREFLIEEISYIHKYLPASEGSRAYYVFGLRKRKNVNFHHRFSDEQADFVLELLEQYLKAYKTKKWALIDEMIQKRLEMDRLPKQQRPPS